MSIDAFVLHLSKEKNYSPHTVLAYQNDVMAFADFCEDEHQLAELVEVQYPIIRNWIVNLVEAGLSNRSINRKMASLKAYYKFLQKTGLLDASPLAKHKALKTDKKVEIPFSEDEMRKILSQIPFGEDFEGARDRLIIEMLYTTGVRRAELVNLKLVNVDASQQTIKVLGKRNKERIVPLLDTTMGFLDQYLRYRNNLENIHEPTHLLLTKTGHKIYENLVYRIINKYLSMVSPKVKKSPHVLRHTFATHLLNNGADLNSVKELLGHSSLTSTQVYTHNSIAELKKVHLSAHPRNKNR
ncbi:tyrosine-type recombinase/integrase [Flagellimonas lutaonensis]|uniref:Tyrosine recombinase XerC n=1 Tax=Flagellimonas lutaonensis TaxID=516051 RepID=A0A0D5YU30_9FLAO|nr:tyrosine-type recombinase/integrase [Allomuricauda lutaonensis]AKA35837.1 Tyrosine recombinase XerC [Allomuricauda lutaonensis]